MADKILVLLVFCYLNGIVQSKVLKINFQAGVSLLF